MRKAELVAFLIIWVGIILRCVGQRASDKTCMISQFEGTWGRAHEGDIETVKWQHFTYSKTITFLDNTEDA